MALLSRLLLRKSKFYPGQQVYIAVKGTYSADPDELREAVVVDTSWRRVTVARFLGSRTRDGVLLTVHKNRVFDRDTLDSYRDL